MQYRIKISQGDFEELKQLVFADFPKEAAAFALAGIARRPDCNDVIIRRPISIPNQLYNLQHEYRLDLSSAAVNGLIALCESNGLGAVLCHSHPADIPYSPSDDHGERRVFQALRQFIHPNAPTASLLFYPEGVRARIWPAIEDEPIPVSEILVIGRSVRRISLNTSGVSNHAIPEVYDRQVLALGKEGQNQIMQTKVGIVGVGGTGSPTVEQLTRLGVEDLVLIDHDIFEPSNRSRVYGTFASSYRPRWRRFFKGPPKKVNLVAKHLMRVNPRARIKAIPKNVVLHESATALLDRDLIFLCTDDHWGRSIVNQIAYQYFIPTLNLGVSIAAPNKKVSLGLGVVDILRPDLPCLWCSNFLNSERIAAESMPIRDRWAREAEGYIQGLNDPAPSVISMTTTISGHAVTLFLQLVTDFMGQKGRVERFNWYLLDGSACTGRKSIQTPCVCSDIRAFGDLKPLPTIADMSFLYK